MQNLWKFHEMESIKPSKIQNHLVQLLLRTTPAGCAAAPEIMYIKWLWAVLSRLGWGGANEHENFSKHQDVLQNHSEACVAQLIEHHSITPKVQGSNPRHKQANFVMLGFEPKGP